MNVNNNLTNSRIDHESILISIRFLSFNTIIIQPTIYLPTCHDHPNKITPSKKIRISTDNYTHHLLRQKIHI